MTVPEFKPVFRPKWYAVMCGLSFWLLIGIVGYSFYKVIVP
jgi:hypothetical protein